MNNQESKPISIRTLLWIITFAVVLFWMLEHIQAGLTALQTLLAVTMPLLQGLVIAFIFNLPMSAIERRLGRWSFGRRRAKLPPAALRGISLSVTLLLVLLLTAAVLMLVLPQIIASLTDLSQNLPNLITRAQQMGTQLLADQPQLAGLIDDLSIDSASITAWAADRVAGEGAGWIGSTVTLMSAVFGGVVSIVLSLIFALYVLISRDRLLSQFERLSQAVLPARINQPLHRILKLANRIFSSFFAGQFIEALILGGIFMVILSLFGFPYALLISVLIAVTALIPMVGAYIALVIGAFLILLINPWQALAFIVIFLVVQQLENNLIYPRVVGSSIGLPAIWVLTAVVIGGGLFGVLGMIFFIPLTSVVYALLRDFVNHKSDKASTTI